MRVAMKTFGLCLVAAILAAGCAKREDAKLAEFKDKVITVGDFETTYAKVDDESLPKKTGEEGLREFLDTMINKEILAYKADELGYDKDPSVAQGMEMFSKMALQIAYLKREVADKIQVSDDELRKAYDNVGIVVTFKQILTDVQSQAEEAYAALKGGTDFETVCKQYSKLPDAADGGQLLTATWGRLMPQLHEVVFDLPVGGYTEPTFTAQGWVIVKVVKRSEPGKKDSFDEMKDELREQLRSIKQQAALARFTEKLRDDYGVVWNYDNMAIAYNALPPDRPLDTPPSRTDEVYPLLYFDPADLDKPLVTYGDKTVTIKDFSDYYDQASFFARPRRFYRLGGIRSFLTERVMNVISADAVQKSGIENDPEVKRVLQAKKEQLMVNLLFEDMIGKKAVITADQIRNYYNDNKPRFEVPEKRKYGVVLTGDRETAEHAYRDLKSGEKLSTVVLAYSVDEQTKDTMGETQPMARGEQPEIDAVGFALAKVGDVSEPFETSRGWMVLKLLEKQDAKVFSLEEAKDRITSTLRQEQSDKRLDELLDRWKKELNVVVYDKNLSKIHLPERLPESQRPGAKRRAAEAKRNATTGL